MSLTQHQILRSYLLADILTFTRFFFKVRFKRKFVVGEHHLKIAEALNRVLSGETKRLIINIAPRYGKTELAVKNFIAAGLALNSRAKFIHLSYSDDLVRDNSSEVQAIMRTPEYQSVFRACPTSTNSKKWYTQDGGGLYAVSSSGQVTGFGAGLVEEEEKRELDGELEDLESTISDNQVFGGAIIIDDPIKPDDALSPLIRNKVNNKFETTIRSRVNSRNTPIVIIMQRVHEEDLCGFLLRQEPDDWEVLRLPCIYIDGGEEKALWSFKHNLEELKKLRDKSSFVFDTQYMQDPKPLQGLMYEQGFKEYEILPATRRKTRKNYTDTADEGKDFLCSICYIETEIGNFVTDVLYTQKAMEYTEPKTAEMLTKHDTQVAVIESNNGGRGFARAVEKLLRLMGNNKTRLKWFHQALNKNVRIFSHSAEVQNLTYFPRGWDRLWPDFYRAITSYMKVGKNDFDDAEDAITGTIEFKDKEQAQDLAGYF